MANLVLQKFLIVCSLVVVGTNAGGYHQFPWTSTDLTPWPKPSSFTNGTGTLVVHNTSVKISLTATSSLLNRAILRYMKIVQQQSVHSPVPVSKPPSASFSLVLDIVDSSEKLEQGTDESYRLQVNEDGTGTLHAQTVFGGLKGMESWAQLIESGASSGTLQMRGLPWTISDSPRFLHRGMLLDTSRHYLPLDVIQQNIDAMAMTKINLLHLHLVDFQSFPFESASAPLLVKGAYSPHQTYTPTELKALVSYAKDRGVRIMVEVDTPGHSASWGVGYPDVITHCPVAMETGGGGVVALDPSNEETFATVEKVLGELGDIFPDSTFHLGGDEVRFQCWAENLKVKEFMIKQGYGTNFSLLEAYYENRLMTIAARVLPNRTLMVYQEVFDNKVVLPSKVVFGVWKSRPMSPPGSTNLAIPEEVSEIAKAGHQVVLANGNNGDWYLNDGFGNGNQVSDWTAVYNLDPLNGTDHLLTPEEQKLVIGGEVSLWGEEINENNLISKGWPRSCAFGERMWSDRKQTTGHAAIRDAGLRLNRAYCKLEARGIHASPVSPGSCYQMA